MSIAFALGTRTSLRAHRELNELQETPMFCCWFFPDLTRTQKKADGKEWPSRGRRSGYFVKMANCLHLTYEWVFFFYFTKFDNEKEAFHWILSNAAEESKVLFLFPIQHYWLTYHNSISMTIFQDIVISSDKFSKISTGDLHFFLSFPVFVDELGRRSFK